ncbi:hypothetical protein EWM62_07365 [Mucilaginibacter terrigena]|uniref:Uncharacterized protein n=1 Tax=Mucilaginibacter terrigena TaxID=2492395 RepID=A0A4Q5LLF2_9SPHI|nr:hypothetical protein [Mucilaginibacter terrigena]RYU90468.1 hypothetical protein EWM62_07365 [Mucilaginibacter terrigena]
MNKLYYKLFVVLFLGVAISGCKLDAPVYPADTIYTPPAGGGGGGGNTASSRTITYTVDGKSTTLKNNVIFQVYTPEQKPPDGAIQIAGGASVTELFSLLANITGKGTFNADIIAVGTSLVGDGTVTVTEYSATANSKGTIAGTFTGELIDISGDGETKKTVTGSFSIKM